MAIASLNKVNSYHARSSRFDVLFFVPYPQHSVYRALLLKEVERSRPFILRMLMQIPSSLTF